MSLPVPTSPMFFLVIDIAEDTQRRLQVIQSVGSRMGALIHFVVPLMPPPNISQHLMVAKPSVEPGPIRHLHMAQLLATPRHPESKGLFEGHSFPLQPSLDQPTNSL